MSGLCECGCGGTTSIARRNNSTYGHVAGQHVRFISGHANRGRGAPLTQRFWPKVREADVDDLSPNGRAGCWLWTAALNTNGYGQMNDRGKHLPAHIVAYELVAGPVPEGLELDHLCRRRMCVNPMHLEPVSRAVNVQRGARAKLDEEKVLAICALRAEGWTLQAIADRFGVTNQRVHEIVRGDAWRNVERAT